MRSESPYADQRRDPQRISPTQGQPTTIALPPPTAFQTSFMSQPFIAHPALLFPVPSGQKIIHSRSRVTLENRPLILLAFPKSGVHVDPVPSATSEQT